MKRKTLSLTLCLLTCLALIGVGFAAWLITYTDQETVNGNIKVETVSDLKYEITVDKTTDNIIFAAPETMTASNPWLTSDGKTSDGVTNHEKLTATFIVTVKITNNGVVTDKANVNVNEDSDANLPKLTAELTMSPEHKNIWDTAKGNEVVKGLTVSIQENNSGSDYTYTITISAEWGDHFKLGGTNVNPYLFYNDGTKTAATHGADAKTYLGYVATLANIAYTLTITVK